MLYASKYHDIPVVVNLSGRYDLKKGISERLGEDFMERIKKDKYIDVQSQKTGITSFTQLLSSFVYISQICTKIQRLSFS